MSDSGGPESETSRSESVPDKVKGGWFPYLTWRDAFPTFVVWLACCQYIVRRWVVDGFGYGCKMVCLAFAIGIGVSVGMGAQKPIILHVSPNGQPPQTAAAKPCGCGQTPTPIAAKEQPGAKLVPVPNIPVEAVFRR